MAARCAVLATLAAVAGPTGCLAAGRPQCAASASGVHFQSSSDSVYTGLQARVHFSKWGDGVFSSIKNLSDGAVELVFAESARNKTILKVGWSGDAALSFRGVRALVQRTAYRANGLAGESELRVEFESWKDKPCFQDCASLVNASGAVLILMVYRDRALSEDSSSLAAFLDGVARSDLTQVHKAGFDASSTDQGDHMAAYFPTDPLGASGCHDIVHIVQLKPVPSASIPAEFCGSLAQTLSDIPPPKIEQILLSTRSFPQVGHYSLQEIRSRWYLFFTILALVNIGLLQLFFLLEWRKRRLALRHEQYSTSVDSQGLEDGDPEAQGPSSALLPRTPQEYKDDLLSSHHVADGQEFLQGYSLQDFEDSYAPAVVEYWNLLDAQEQCHWNRSRRLVCLCLHIAYVALCLSEPIIDKFVEQAATCYQGILWERVFPMVWLYIVSKIFELVLLAMTNKARGQIRWAMLPIEFMAGALSFSNAYSDIISIVVARACLQEAWWGAMMVVFTLGVVVFHWMFLVVLSLRLDRSNKCLYKILHMSVLAGGLQLHPEDTKAWYLWTAICWSQIIVQDLMMGGLQIWFWMRVEHNGSFGKAIMFTVASFLLSVRAAVDPTVAFGPQELQQLLAIAKLQHYMAQSIEDYDKGQMRILLEEASGIRLLQESQTLEKAKRFKCEQELQIQEGSTVGAYFPVYPEGRSSRPYPAKVERINYSAFTVRLKLEGDCAEEGVSRESVDVDRRYIVEDRDLTAALIGLGILKESDPTSMHWADELPPWECQVMKSLHGCQRNALKRVRDSAESLHRIELGNLRERCRRLDIDRDGLEQIFEWVLWDAPIIIHIDLDTVGRYLMVDSYYRNQFETGTSKGLNILPIREGWEEKLFGECYKDALPFERPKYGVLDIMNDPEGVAAAKGMYGRSYAILKQARFRCTLTPRDSGQSSVGFEHTGTLDMCAHVLMEFSDEELREVHRVATAEDSRRRIGDSRQIEGFNYKELQLHGELDLKKHVKRLVVDPQHLVYGLCNAPDGEQKLDQAAIERLCQEHGWELSYIGDPDKARDAGFSESKFRWEKDIRMEHRWRTCPTNEDNLARSRSKTSHEGMKSVMMRLTRGGQPDGRDAGTPSARVGTLRAATPE